MDCLIFFIYSDKIGESFEAVQVVFNVSLTELIWRVSPSTITKNSTVFWCSTRDETSNNVKQNLSVPIHSGIKCNKLTFCLQCDGDVEWQHVKDALSLNVTLSPEKNYRFAVNVKTSQGSTGMKWVIDTFYNDKGNDCFGDLQLNEK